MGNNPETFRFDAVHPEFLDEPVSRRTLLQSISAITVASASSGITLASADSADASPQKRRRLRIDQKFVLFPINNESLLRRVRLASDSRVLRSFSASLGLPAQWWAHLDVSAWQGQTLELSVEPDHTPPSTAGEIPGRGANETDDAELVAAIRTSAQIWSRETLYREPLRPAFHFSPRRGWMNDPNGLLYHAGQYHMFFQHNPYGVRGGSMHWGHAVSRDLVRWTELPIALYPHGDNDEAYSGGGAVDHDNTSGWGRNGRPPMVVVFHSTGRGVCIAYSNDDGATWSEFDGNPVISNSGATCFQWHRPTRQWVLVGRDAEDGTAFYTSPDLKSWQKRSSIEGGWDLFALPVDGSGDRVKWVLVNGPGDYRIGEFDGSRFIPESPQLPGPTGGSSTLYRNPFQSLFCPLTFSNHPEGHVVEIAWGVVQTPGAPFTQLMSFPTTLSLQTTRDGVRLCREPVDAIRSLRNHTYEIAPGPLTNSPLLSDLVGDAWDIEAVIRMGPMSPIVMSIGGDQYVYDPTSQMLIGPKGAMSIPLSDGRLRMRVLVDKTTVEVFGDRGQAYGMFVRSNPGGKPALGLREREGNIPMFRGAVEKLSAHSLRSAWKV